MDRAQHALLLRQLLWPVGVLLPAPPPPPSAPQPAGGSEHFPGHGPTSTRLLTHAVSRGVMAAAASGACGGLGAWPLSAHTRSSLRLFRETTFWPRDLWAL